MKKELIALCPDAKPAFGPARAPSFGDMVEQTWREGGRLRDLFAKVSQNWAIEGHDFGPDDLRAVFAQKLDPERLARKRAKEENLFKTDQPLKGTAKENITALIDTFGLSGDKELKLWRIGCGELKIEWGALSAQIGALLTKADDEDLRHDFMHALHQSSGITDPAAASRLGVDPRIVIQWKVGRTKIEKLDHARQLTDIYIPDFLEPPSQVKEDVVRALTGRTHLDDLEGLIESAERSENPVNTLALGLFSKKSIFGLTVKDAARKLKMAAHCVHERFNEKTPISEIEAVKLVSLIKATPSQKKRILNILTHMDEPAVLMRKVEKGHVTFTAAAIKMRMRKGASFDLMCQKLKIGYIGASALESGGHVPLKTAKILADFYFGQSARKSEEYLWFICCAIGKRPLRREMLFAELYQGKIDPYEGLEYLAAFNGLSVTGWLRENNFATKHLKEVREQNLTPRMAARFAEAAGCCALTFRHFSKNYDGRHLHTPPSPS